MNKKEYKQFKKNYQKQRENDVLIATKLLDINVIGWAFTSYPDGYIDIDLECDWRKDIDKEPLYLKECSCEWKEETEFYKKNIFGHHWGCLDELPHYHQFSECYYEIEEKIIDKNLQNNYFNICSKIMKKDLNKKELTMIDYLFIKPKQQYSAFLELIKLI